MFVSFRLLVVESILIAWAGMSYVRLPVGASRIRESAPPRLRKNALTPGSASISDDTIQMDHNAVVLFTIDRLAHSPRTTVRTRGTELAPDRWFIK